MQITIRVFVKKEKKNSSIINDQLRKLSFAIKKQNLNFAIDPQSDVCAKRFSRNANCPLHLSKNHVPSFFYSYFVTKLIAETNEDHGIP